MSRSCIAGAVPSRRIWLHVWEIVVAMIDDEATVKRFSRKNGHVWLLPENDDYEPIDGTYAQILGKVVAVVRQY